MKLSPQWKTLTRGQRLAWNAWAKTNNVMLDDGNARRVSGHKAMTMVLRNRALAGEALNPATPPAAATWLGAALSLEDAGPYTEYGGMMVFRTAQALAAGTKWFVWATRPMDPAEKSPQSLLRFVKFMTLGAIANNSYIPRFDDDYRAVIGSFAGPGARGAWDVPMNIWFRVHQYADGQLGPGTLLWGPILIDV